MAQPRVEVTPIGFTGNQDGYNAGASPDHTGERAKTIFTWLAYLRARLRRVVVHHGDCVGSDYEFHGQALAMGIPRVIHPPANPAKRAFANKRDTSFATSASNTSTVLTPEPYLDRNWALVDATRILIAAPRGRAEEQRSGTWATIRHARGAKRWIIIVYPDGTWKDEGQRPGWCQIQDDKFIQPDNLGHRWDGDWCVSCGFDSTDAMGFGDHSLPTCDEWRGLACLCRTGGAMICKSCADGDKCQCRVCFSRPQTS